jgi:hypothetical protein
MNTKQLQLVNFEQAKRLKALGFDWETQEYYHPNGEILDLLFYSKNGGIKAPTVALVLKWIRDEKGYDCMVHRSYADNTKYLGEVYKFDANDVERAYIQSVRIKQQNTYEAAESALLDELLTIMEEEQQ